MKIRSCLGLLVLLSTVIGTGAAETAASTAAMNPITLRVAGSSILDSGGEFTGNIEAVVLDPRSSQVGFAMISTAYPSNRLTVTPVPWQMLHQRSDARLAVGIPVTYQ